MVLKTLIFTGLKTVVDDDGDDSSVGNGGDCGSSGGVNGIGESSCKQSEITVVRINYTNRA